MKGINHQPLEWPIIGHQNIVKFLQKSIINDRITHAYLFSGLEHLGKRTVGEYFAASLLTNSEQGSPEFIQGKVPNKFGTPKFETSALRKHPDYYEIKRGNGKKNISIDQIRNLREKLNLRSFLGGYKVALIDQAESMTEEASNALLKTLEEPSEKTVIILISNNADILPKTIVSRCQVVRFLPVLSSIVIASLEQNGVEREVKQSRDLHSLDGIASSSCFFQKKCGISRNDKEKIVALSEGRPGVLINFLENPEELKKYQEKAEEFVEILKSDLSKRWQIIDRIIPKESKFLESQEVFQNLLLIWKLVVRNVLLIKVSQIVPDSSHEIAEPTFVARIAKSGPPAMTKLTEKYSSDKLKEIIEEINLTQKYLGQNVNPRLAIENLILKL